ncbi:hypothetical protein D3C71_175130 [compost metagenome]
MKLFHGTSAAKGDRIRQDGFLPESCFTPNIDDAVYYAATGGEADLQLREEEWEAENGYPPREDYGSELWSMFEDLYPKGDRPVVIVVEIADDMIGSGTPDSGAENGIRFAEAIDAGCVMEIADVEWDLIDQIGYDPTARNVRTAIR